MENRMGDRPRLVMWELTRACRLACAHCPIGSQPRRSALELSTYEAYKTIDQIVAISPEEIIITGGDPLERPDIYELIDYTRRRGLQPSLMVSATPALTGAAIGKLKRNGLGSLIISVDSAAPEKHDSARGVSGQFGATLLAIRWARTAELPVEINTLLGRQNLHELPRIAELLTDVGVHRWNVFFQVPVGGSKHVESLTAAEVEQGFEQLHLISRRASFGVRTFEAPHYRRFVLQKAVEERLRSVDDYFEAGDGGLRVGDDTGRAAVAVNNYLYITHHGEATLSPFLPMTAGNVRYQPLNAIYRHGELFAAVRDEVNLKGKCGRCEFRTVCGGSRARAFAMTGDLFASDPLCVYEPGTFLPVAHTVVPEAAPRT
ncbi:MAG: radical SAM protein [Thermoanaerobaculia bacterium]